MRRFPLIHQSNYNYFCIPNNELFFISPFLHCECGNRPPIFHYRLSRHPSIFSYRYIFIYFIAFHSIPSPQNAHTLHGYTCHFHFVKSKCHCTLCATRKHIETNVWKWRPRFSVNRKIKALHDETIQMVASMRSRAVCSSRRIHWEERKGEKMANEIIPSMIIMLV